MEQEEKLFKRLDKIIVLLETIAQPPSLLNKVLSGFATFVGILGILSIIDIIKNWTGG